LSLKASLPDKWNSSRVETAAPATEIPVTDPPVQPLDSHPTGDGGLSAQVKDMVGPPPVVHELKSTWSDSTVGPPKKSGVGNALKVGAAVFVLSGSVAGIIAVAIEGSDESKGKNKNNSTHVRRFGGTGQCRVGGTCSG
jgi:hypothetical protein